MRSASQNHRLADLFCTAAGLPGEPSDDTTDDVTRIVEAALARTARRWPGMDIDAGLLATAWGRSVSGEADPVAAFRDRAAEDLALARACLEGDEAALAAFEEVCFAELGPQLDRLKIPDDVAKDAMQRTRERLLVDRPDRPAKLRDYAGTGDLRAWVKVIVVREAMRARRRGQRDVPLSHELATALPDDDADPELAYQRDLYGEEFREAFAAAVETLSDRERSLLRQAILHRSTVDQIAAVYDVHRATAARWVARARQRLADATRDRLIARLGVSDSQLDSIARLVDSQIDLSVERLLRDDES